MSESRFKTMRHIETVRNYLNRAVLNLLERGEKHDQTKLESPEKEIFEIYTPKLRETVYGSDEYKQYLHEMSLAIEHHNIHNSHHPEYYPNGIIDMSLFDLIEMICDWKASSMRNKKGNILKSLEINQTRFGYSNDLKQIFKNTLKEIQQKPIRHKANES